MALTQPEIAAKSEVLPFRDRLKRLMELPVFYKLLFANSFVIFVGGTVGTYLASQIYRPMGDLAYTANINSIRNMIIFVSIGWILSVIINFLLLKIALNPLTRLRETMRDVQAGNLDLRAEITGQDPEADQLATTLNKMLDALGDTAQLRASQILAAQEQERKRIARELHDETSQLLTSLLISLAVLEESVTIEENKKQINDSRALAHQTLRAIRNLSLDLRPSALDDLGLIPAIRGYIKEVQQRSGMTIELTATGFRDRLPAEIETTLYRVVQEALTNSTKHSQASLVNVKLEETDSLIKASIKDNGVGFDRDSVFKTPWQERGLGLAGMQERATLLKGNINISSKPGSGTSIEIEIPCASFTGSKLLFS